MNQDLRYVLAVDIGNTRLKWAFHDGRSWVAQGACSTSNTISHAILVKEWALLASHMVTQSKKSPAFRAIISNVADKAIADIVIEALNDIGCMAVEIITPRAAQAGVRNSYIRASQLGSDRWLALIAAYNLMKINTQISGEVAYSQLVVMAGTALTIDALTADGTFLGGVIVPGVALMQAALNLGTARLPATAGLYEIFPTATQNAIYTGAIEASLGVLQRMQYALTERTNNKVKCIASGGGVTLLLPHLTTLTFPVAVHDNLVLEGLIRVANEHC